MVGENDNLGGIQGTAETAQIAAANEAINESKEAASGAHEAFDGWSVGISQAASRLSGLSDTLKNNAGDFAILSTAMLGANHQFETLGKGFGVDTDRLNTFTKQFDGLFDILAKSPGIGFSKDMMSMFAGLGASHDKLAQLGSATGAAAAKMGKDFLANADNMLYAQNAMTQMIARTGEWAKIQDGIPGLLSAAGAGLANINKTGADYVNMLKNVQQATNTQPTEVNKWADSLAAMPGALEAMMTPMTIAGQHMTGLEAAMKMATGTGMDQKMVTDAVAGSMKQYGLSMEDALKYSARTEEITNAIKGARVEDVQAALNATTNRFKDYVYGAADAAAMTQSLSSAQENYMNILKAGNVPAATAIELSTKMAEKMHDLSLAQRAYLSQQTGGPGGLMGAGQIEKMLQQPGGAEKVMEKMQEAMRHRMGGGPLMTLEKAETAQDFAKLQQEKQMLMHGPVKMADTEQEANAIITAMSKKGGALSKTEIDEVRKKFTAEKDIDRGAAIEGQTATRVGQMQVAAEMAQITAGQFTLNGIQGAFTEKMGHQGGVDALGAGVATNKANLANTRTDASDRGTHMGSAMGNTMANATNLAANFTDTVQQGAKSMFETIMSGNKPATQPITPQAVQQQIQHPVGGVVNQANHDAQMQKLIGGVHNAGDRYTPAGKQVGGVIPHTPTHDADTSESKSLGGVKNTGNQPIPVTLVGGGLTVNFVGKCPHCNTNINTTASTSSISQTAGQRAPSST